MKRRRGWKKGDWLVQDEESGFTTYGKAVGRDYYGVLKVKKQMDSLHPQTFIKPKDDPYTVDPISPPMRSYESAVLSWQGPYVNNSTVPVLPSPADSLFRTEIPYGQIGSTFYVY